MRLNISDGSFLGILLLTMGASGCQRGTIYVSHPQVHTRERLVAQRLREDQWLEKQLEKTDDIKTTFQGLRDFREFVGFYGEMAAAVNPTQGKLDKLTNESRELELETQLWKQRQSEVDARLSYYKSLLDAPKKFSEAADGAETSSAANGGGETTDDSGTGDDQSGEQGSGATAGDTATAPSGLAANNTGAPPAVKAPFGMKPSDIVLPDPSKVTKTQAEAHPLDLFHDKLAYRNAVNAALKENELDDSHDFAGQMLYELTLAIAIAPGDHSQQFAQVELELEPPSFRKRVPELERLYDNWIEELQMQLVGDIATLQSQIVEGSLNERDEDYLKWFFADFGPSLLSRMQLVLDERDEFGTDATLRAGTKLEKASELTLLELAIEGTYGNETTSSVQKRGDGRFSFDREDAQRLQQLLRKFETKNTGKVFRELREHRLVEEEMRDLREACAWTVWGAHFLELDRLIGIRAPKFDDASRIVDGLEARRRKAFDTRACQLIAAGLHSPVDLPPAKGLGTTGVACFVRRLYDAEKTPHALVVRPTEHAQSISEASARETMLNLLLAIDAMLPNSGVNSSTRSQYVRRAQTYLHAITRQPLLVGYGSGQQRFGWFLGPSFVVEEGKASFEHRLVRHDVSAGIVVPAWNNRVHLKGYQYWIDSAGRSVARRTLWAKEENKQVSLNLRIPEDATRHITQALLAQSISGGRYRRTSRPYPDIHSPSRENLGVVQSVRPGTADELPQQILIRGSHLWRHPEVFLGSLKADSVEVLSDMNGLYARFNRVPYPSAVTGTGALLPMPADLTVATSFGQDSRAAVVQILPPIDLPKTEPKPVELLQTYVDDKEQSLVFIVERPQSYGALKIALKAAQAPDEEYKEEAYPAQWSADNKQLSFAIGPRPTVQAPTILDVQLRLYPRSDTPAGMVKLNGKGQRFARFFNQAERSASLTALAIKYDLDNQVSSPVKLALQPTALDAIYVAYPEVKGKMAGGKSAMHAWNEDAAFDLPLSLVTNSVGVLEATEATFEDPAIRGQLVAPAIKGKPLKVVVRYKTDSDKQIDIPVVDSSGIPASFSVEQDPMPASPPFQLRTPSGTFKAGSLDLQNAIDLALLPPTSLKHFQHKEALDKLLLQTDKEVSVVAEEVSNRNKVYLSGQLSKDGDAFLIRITKSPSADAKTNLLAWTATQGVTLSEVRLTTHAEAIAVSNSSGGAATIRFQE